jgi:Tfp pilus assembly protein PilO
VTRNHWIVVGAFAAAFAAVSYLGWALLIKPVEKRIEEKLATRDDVQKKLIDAKTKAAQFDKFRAQAENIRRDLNLISQRLAPDFPVRESNRMQARLVSESSLIVSAVTVEKRAQSKEAGFSNLDAVPITIPFNGGFHEVGNFLNSVISGQRMIVPNAITLGQVTDPTLVRATVNGTINLTLYLDQASSGGPK